MYTKFIFFWIIIIIPFLIGKKVQNRTLHSFFDSEKLINFNLALLEPLILLWSIWGLNINREVALLPFIGFFFTAIAVFLSLFISGILKHDRLKSHSFQVIAALSNQGFTMGAFICYLVIGEKGLGLASIYILYFMPLVFLMIFPYSHYISSKHSLGSELKFNIRSMIFTRKNCPVLAVILAIILNITGIQRPDIFFPMDFLLALTISIYYFTLGTSFFAGDIRDYKREILSISLLKFLIIPAITYIFLMFIDLDKSLETVILIQSFMPAAIYSVVTSVLFRLDTKMTSTVFFVTNLMFIVVIPIILFAC